MHIPNELLSEKNYTGSRLIEITDEKVKELQLKLKEYQKEANPILEEMEKITPQMDPIFQKLQELERQKQALQAELAPIREPYDELLQKVEKIDQKAQAVKNKIQPIVNGIIEPQLGEFEKALHLKEEGDQLFVEVVDEIEEKVKALRAAKAKK